ncbi:hypothetical protein BBJ28_00012671 [Nothophytophthora sp. Chile5]|nr:hypothetical protein BBJ28_00012671 [Nothophytophthora sp. Chile5]
MSTTTGTALFAAVAAGAAAAQRLHPNSRRAQELHTQDVEAEQRVLRLQGDEGDDETEAGAAKQDDDLVQDLPGLDPTSKVTQHAGRISLDDSDKNSIFYWHFQAAQDPDKAPLVICGISPFKLVDESTIAENEDSWHHTANLLFVDQPVGTGMSYTRGNDFRTDEDSVADDFYQFLTKFLTLHSGYLSTSEGVQRSRPVYIFGESHAGRWIPEFSEYILQQNDEPNKQIRIDLAGVGIGNGWVHPRIQYEYSDFAHGLGLLTFGQVRSLQASFAECLAALDAGTYYSTSCLGNMDAITDSIKTGSGGKSLNYYDVRQYLRNVGSYPSGQNVIVKYLNQMDVRKALHGNTDKNFRFDVCSNGVFRALSKLDGVSTLNKVQSLLQGGLKMLFYNGQWDMMCNHYGTETLLLNLDWNGSDAYQQADKYTWRVEGRKEPAGFAQQGGNLTYLVVTGAGHMVPMDVPDVAADMLHRFVHGLEFSDKAQSVANTAMNASDLELSHCYLSSSDTSTTGTTWAQQDQTGSSSSHVHMGITWLWVALVIAAVSSVLAVCVTVACLRSKRQSDHEMIMQVSDDEDLEEIEEEEEEEEGEEGERVPVNGVNQRSPSPRSRASEV